MKFKLASFKGPLIFFFIIIVCFFISGCAKKEEQSKIIEPSKNITISLAGWVSSSAEEEMLLSAIESFEKANSGIKVRYMALEKEFQEQLKKEDFFTVLEKAFKNGNPPDIFYMDAQSAYQFESKGLLLPLNDLMQKYQVRPDEFYPNLLRAFQYNVRTYGIPKDFNTLGLFYNKEIFDENGVPYPDETWNWDTLAEAAAKLTVKPEGTLYGISLPPDPARWLPFALQNGAKIFSSDNKKCLLDSPEAVQALEFYYSFQQKKISLQPYFLDFPSAGDVFANRKAAMVIEGGWLIPFLKKKAPDLKYGVAQLPSGPKGRGNLLFVVAYSISKDCKYPEEAFMLINHLTSQDFQRNMLRTGFALPSRVALIDAPYYRENPDSVAILRGMDYAAIYQFGNKGSKFNVILNLALRDVFDGKKLPQDALVEAVRKISEGN